MIRIVFGILFSVGLGAACGENDGRDHLAGLVAVYDDGSRKVTSVVALPEFGLAEGESPHPAIKPVFEVEYRGKLQIKQPGKYEFDYGGKVTINGKPVTGGIALAVGYHDLVLRYKRVAGKVAVGFYWQSEHFIKEPVPPGVLWHGEKVASVDDWKGNYSSPPFRMAQTMKQMKCASCHDAGFLTTMHHKFAPDALMTHIRHANVMKWYGAMTGPLFKEDEKLVQLVKDLQKLPRSERSHKPGKDQAKGLKMVGAKNGLACIACHDIRHHRTAAESKGPNLAYISKRVTYDWFVRWMNDPQRLMPGVPMPAFFAGQKPEERRANIDALWDYLLLGEKMPLPEELRTDPNQFVLKPKGRALVNRVYIRLPDKRELLRAICVGLPNGISYCFDAETCQLVYVWSGGYLDMTDHWKNQSLHPVATVGETVMLLSPGEGIRVGRATASFRGYKLVDGVPHFEFSFGRTLVKLAIDSPKPGEIRQTFVVAKRSEPVRFIGPAANSSVSAVSSMGTWSGRLLQVNAKGETRLVINLRKKKP